jgi:hypothetical protein
VLSHGQIFGRRRQALPDARSSRAVGKVPATEVPPGAPPGPPAPQPVHRPAPSRLLQLWTHVWTDHAHSLNYSKLPSAMAISRRSLLIAGNPSPEKYISSEIQTAIEQSSDQRNLADIPYNPNWVVRPVYKLRERLKSQSAANRFDATRIHPHMGEDSVELSDSTGNRGVTSTSGRRDRSGWCLRGGLFDVDEDLYPFCRRDVAAAQDHRVDLCDVADIVERIRVQHDQIGDLPTGDRAGVAFGAEEARGSEVAACKDFIGDSPALTRCPSSSWRGKPG